MKMNINVFENKVKQQQQKNREKITEVKMPRKQYDERFKLFIVSAQFVSIPTTTTEKNCRKRKKYNSIQQSCYRLRSNFNKVKNKQTHFVSQLQYT